MGAIHANRGFNNIYNNDLYGGNINGTPYGIGIEIGGSNNHIYNNLICGSPIGISDLPDDEYNREGENNTVENNHIYNQLGIILREGLEEQYYHNTIQFIRQTNLKINNNFISKGVQWVDTKAISIDNSSYCTIANNFITGDSDGNSIGIGLKQVSFVNANKNFIKGYTNPVKEVVRNGH